MKPNSSHRTRTAERAQSIVSCKHHGVHSTGCERRWIAFLVMAVWLISPTLGCAHLSQSDEFATEPAPYSLALNDHQDRRKLRRPPRRRAKSTSQSNARQKLARYVHDEANSVRRSKGLSPLRWDKALVKIALRHSSDMAHRDYFGHRSPDNRRLGDRYKSAGYQCRAPAGNGRYLGGGENLYVGFGDKTRALNLGRASDATLRALAKRIVKGWLNSPTHRDNLLHRAWRQEGIGISIDKAGKLYATQNFC